MEVDVPHNTILWAYEWSHNDQARFRFTFGILVNPLTLLTHHSLMCLQQEQRLAGAGNGTVDDAVKFMVQRLPS